MKKLLFLLTLLASFLMASPVLAYTVEKGDTMTKIARENGLTLQELAQANPQVKDLDRIFVGQTVHTPSSITVEEQKTNNQDKSIVKASSTTTPKAKTENISISDSDIDLLARIVRAEAQTEPFEGKVAVADVVLNRVESQQFPDTIKEVIYAPGQFQPVSNGEINKPADEESIEAVYVALTDQGEIDHDSLFFYNPDIATSRWLDSRQTTVVIGDHVFKK